MGRRLFHRQESQAQGLIAAVPDRARECSNSIVRREVARIE
jgi:hypothetical protein